MVGKEHSVPDGSRLTREKQLGMVGSQTLEMDSLRVGDWEELSGRQGHQGRQGLSQKDAGTQLQMARWRIGRLERN